MAGIASSTRAPWKAEKAQHAPAAVKAPKAKAPPESDAA